MNEIYLIRVGNDSEGKTNVVVFGPALVMKKVNPYKTKRKKNKII